MIIYHISDELGRHGGALFTGINDTYLFRLPEHVFVHDHAACLATIGLTLNLSKTKCYINEQYQTPQYHTLRGDIAEGFNTDATTG